TGLPLTSGRHSGCRLRFGSDGRLYVATGDAAVGTTPQSLGSLGGKVLRVNWDGSVPSDNPFVSRGGAARYVWSYGHRNLQGLTLRPGTSELWTAEHGPSRDDEVNWVVRGANYGWDPVPGYDESRPMTDLAKFPAARAAMWSSGAPTVATGGTAFLSAPEWGAWRGALAVALLKDQGVLLMRMNPTLSPSRVVQTTRLPQAEGLGRIRTVQQGPDGALWLTTSNGTDDRIVRVAPVAATPTLDAGELVSSSGVTLARTGSEVTTFVRSTGDQVFLRRSADDGRSWAGWAAAGVTSTTAPSATSSASGRVDLVTRSASGSVVHSWFRGGRRLGSTDLGGDVLAQHASSPGDGTLDVFAVAPNGVGYRRHWDGRRWGPWTAVGGEFTSGLSASADPGRGTTVVTGRGTDGNTWERTFTPGGTSGRWATRADGLSGWSDRAQGDTWPGRARLSVGRGPDGSAVVQRGALFVATTAVWTSAGDLVSRSDGSFLLAGRGSDGALWITGGGPSSYSSVSLGGIVR
ncbi:MAG: PQQ-dependent sugar dehydrogenase, partial [Dermatophilaceae bacterium]